MSKPGANTPLVKQDINPYRKDNRGPSNSNSNMKDKRSSDSFNKSGGHGHHGGSMHGRDNRDRSNTRNESRSDNQHDHKDTDKSRDDKEKGEAGEKKFTGRCRLFVGNLTPDVTESDFRKMFETYGEISEVYVNTSRGFGFIRLDYRQNAEAAKAALDGLQRKGRILRVRFATHGAALKVKNLHPYVSNELLEQSFSQFGDLERCVVIVDDRGKSTGEGIVEFVRKPGANSALRRINEGVFLMGADPKPVAVEPLEQKDEEDGMPEKFITKTDQYKKEREKEPHFAPPGTFEYEFGMRWKQLEELEKQRIEQVKKDTEEARLKLEDEMQNALYEYQAEQIRQDLIRQQEELRRLEELRNSDRLRRQQEMEMRRQQDDRERAQQEERRRADMMMNLRQQDMARARGGGPMDAPGMRAREEMMMADRYGDRMPERMGERMPERMGERMGQSSNYMMEERQRNEAAAMRGGGDPSRGRDMRGSGAPPLQPPPVPPSGMGSMERGGGAPAAQNAKSSPKPLMQPGSGFPMGGQAGGNTGPNNPNTNADSGNAMEEECEEQAFAPVCQDPDSVSSAERLGDGGESHNPDPMTKCSPQPHQHHLDKGRGSEHLSVLLPAERKMEEEEDSPPLEGDNPAAWKMDVDYQGISCASSVNDESGLAHVSDNTSSSNTDTKSSWLDDSDSSTQDKEDVDFRLHQVPLSGKCSETGSQRKGRIQSEEMDSALPERTDNLCDHSEPGVCNVSEEKQCRFSPKVSDGSTFMEKNCIGDKNSCSNSMDRNPSADVSETVDRDKDSCENVHNSEVHELGGEWAPGNNVEGSYELNSAQTEKKNEKLDCYLSTDNETDLKPANTSSHDHYISSDHNSIRSGAVSSSDSHFSEESTRFVNEMETYESSQPQSVCNIEGNARHFSDNSNSMDNCVSRDSENKEESQYKQNLEEYSSVNSEFAQSLDDEYNQPITVEEQSTEEEYKQLPEEMRELSDYQQLDDTSSYEQHALTSSSYKQNLTSEAEDMDTETLEEEMERITDPDIYQSYEGNQWGTGIPTTLEAAALAEYNTSENTSWPASAEILSSSSSATTSAAPSSSLNSDTLGSSHNSQLESDPSTSEEVGTDSSTGQLNSSSQDSEVEGHSDGALRTGDQAFKSSTSLQSSVVSSAQSSRAAGYHPASSAGVYTGPAVLQGMTPPAMMSSTSVHIARHPGGATIMQHQSMSTGLNGRIAQATVMQQHAMANGAQATSMMQQRTLMNGGQTMVVQQRTVTTGLGAMAQQTVVQQRVAPNMAQAAAIHANAMRQRAMASQASMMQHRAIRLAQARAMGTLQAQGLSGTALVQTPSGASRVLGPRLVQGSMMHQLVRQRYLGGPVMPGRGVQMLAGRPVRIKMTYPRESMSMDSNT